MKVRDQLARRLAERRGRRGEMLAALLLLVKGYRILGRRVRTKVGEIDLVARSPGGILCFVEVKVREMEGTALEALRMSQQSRILRAAELYLSHRPTLCTKGVRFDLITVGGRQLPRHFPAAW